MAALTASIDNGGGIGAFALLDEVDACAVAPHGKLIDCRRAEGIRRRDDHFFAVSFQLRCNFADGGGLADAVDADNQQHGRLCTELQRFALADHVRHDLAQCRLHLLAVGHALALDAVAQLFEDFLGGADADIRANQQFLQLVKQFFIHLDKALEQIVHLRDEGVLRFGEPFFQFIKKSHVSLLLYTFKSISLTFSASTFEMPRSGMVTP